MREGSVYDWLQRRPWLLDVPVAGFVALLTFGGLLDRVSFLPLLLLSGAPLVLVWRRTEPVTVFTVVCLSLAVRALLVREIMPGDLSFLVALYSLSAYVPRRRPVRFAGLGVAVLAALVATLLFGYVGYGQSSLTYLAFTFFALLAAAVAAWTLGDLKRARLQRLEDLRERAEAVEREREQELRLAGQQERAAIAREMHDVVAHALSVIVVQADGAAFAAQRRPDDARALTLSALETIGATARDALGDTRRLVGVLRDPESGAELAPRGGLDQLGELVDRVRGAGVPVELHVDAPGPALPLPVDLAAYRVVQESLTNIIKHAGPSARARVLVERAPGLVRIAVVDDGLGAGATSDGRGHGIHGMRERVAVHAGTLTAGPAADRGFEVRATIPVPEESPL
ncbi:sensor histidine kinase [Terracoccus luteus]|uniref:histidine kinase n=1 Tax=Terracoccus luteus TaxID=53356 RepID=A0A495Y1L5_9MICO|nr:histidine kinase [Terracoccus luteus]MBB2988015.1 signal transduction histidine kinase [Terracoccus luteus]MCP2173666.1 signal transduction histidine kinase [Terracoccus luteus]RKT80122.1 signal transduction histidine kinase [Terracoccus luteus]